jgi:hypothetical protein
MCFMPIEFMTKHIQIPTHVGDKKIITVFYPPIIRVSFLSGYPFPDMELMKVLRRKFIVFHEFWWSFMGDVEAGFLLYGADTSDEVKSVCDQFNWPVSAKRVDYCVVQTDERRGFNVYKYLGGKFSKILI